MPTTSSRVTSRQHPLVRSFRQAAADPDADALVLLDGAHLIRDALSAKLRVRTMLVSSEFLARAVPGDRAIVDRARENGAQIHEASASVLDAASPVRATSGVVALAEWSSSPVHALLTPAPALAIGLVDVQDPGNLGAAIRSADAFGATGVATSDRSAHPGGWKALRGAMGSTFRVPVARASTDSVIDAARSAGVRVLAATTAGATAIHLIDLRAPVLILLGNEGSGLGEEVLQRADERVRVPMRAGIESLNVAVTASVVLYEAARQRAR